MFMNDRRVSKFSPVDEAPQELVVIKANGDLRNKKHKKNEEKEEFPFLRKLLYELMFANLPAMKIAQRNFISPKDALEKMERFLDLVELMICGLCDYEGKTKETQFYVDFRDIDSTYEELPIETGLDWNKYPLFASLYKQTQDFYQHLKYEVYSSLYNFHKRDMINDEIFDRSISFQKGSENVVVREVKKFLARALILSIQLEKISFFNTMHPHVSKSILLLKKEIIEQKINDTNLLDEDDKRELKNMIKYSANFLDLKHPHLLRRIDMCDADFFLLAIFCIYDSKDVYWTGRYCTIQTEHFVESFRKYLQRPGIGWTLLHEEAFYGSITEAILMRHKNAINSLDYHGYTPIFYTTIFDHVESFKGETLLHVAIKHRAFKIIEFMLNKNNHYGAVQDYDCIKMMFSIKDVDQNTPLHLLLAYNHIHHIYDKLILEELFHMMSPNITYDVLTSRNLWGWTPFQLSIVLRSQICSFDMQTNIVDEFLKIADNGEPENLEKMLLMHVDVDNQFASESVYDHLDGILLKNNAVHLAAASRNSTKLLQLILKYVATKKMKKCIQNENNGHNFKPFDIAVRSGNTETVKLLIKHFIAYNLHISIDTINEIEGLEVKCQCYEYKKRTSFPALQLFDVLDLPHREEILSIILDSNYMPIDYHSRLAKETPFDLAIKRGYRDCVGMFLNHKDWKRILIRRKMHTSSDSPFLLLLHNMPEFMLEIFNKCITHCDECKDTIYDFSLFEDMFIINTADRTVGLSTSPFYGNYPKPHWLPVYNLCSEHIIVETIDWDASDVVINMQPNKAKNFIPDFEYTPEDEDKTKCGLLRPRNETEYLKNSNGAIQALVINPVMRTVPPVGSALFGLEV